MDKCIVRKAILSLEDQQILGYDLVFESSKENFYDRAENAAEDTIYSFLVQNAPKMLKDKPVFITFTPSLLFRNTPKMFEHGKLVIQIEENLIIHPLAMPIIRKYKADGYQFAIHNFQFNAKYFSMLDYADYICIELTDELRSNEKGRESMDNIVRMAKGFHKKCILTQVNSQEDFELAKKMQVEYVEGSYLTQTYVTKVNKMEYLKGNFFQLINEISVEEPNIDLIEEIISRDAGLTYTLLKLVNSTYFALRKKTASVKNALVTMGIRRLREWVYMLSMNVSDNNSSEELLKISFLRATFCSKLAEKITDLSITPSEAYMMGIFSCMEFMVDASLEEILQDMPIHEDIKNALLTREGRAGKLYSLVLNYENAHWKENKELIKELGLDSTELAQTYMDCIDSVNAIWASLTSGWGQDEELHDSEELAEEGSNEKNKK